MALMETHYYSSSLGSNITLNVFVPTPGSSEQITQMGHSAKYDYENGLPVLYLLHGAYGDAFSWVRYSNIDRYAQDRGLWLSWHPRKILLSGSSEREKVQDLLYGGTAALHPQCISGEQGAGEDVYRWFFHGRLRRVVSGTVQTGAVREGGEHVRRAGHCGTVSGGGSQEQRQQSVSLGGLLWGSGQTCRERL